ncbi:MAG: hypothetical protein IJN75_03440 [Clostridia bacterium]|nr:hypothetical protein [Clostridia bacterium]
MKRIATLLLAVLMIAVLIVPASAKAGDAIITLDLNTGAAYETAKHVILTRIGDKDTISEVNGFLLSVEGGKDYNYFYVYTVEKSGDAYVITAMSKTLGRPDGVKSDLAIPENGFLLCFQAGDEANKAIMDTVAVGDYVELSGVDLNELATLDAGANPLAGAATATIKAAEPDSYIWAKWGDATDTTNPPSFQLVLGEEDLSVLEAGKQYQVFAKVWFSDDCTGNVYFNFYAYADAAAAEANDWAYLNSFQDFASSATAGDKLGKWATYESNLVNFGIDSYEGDGSDIGCKGMTVGMGFWQAAGEVRVSECGIKDADGNVVFTKKFDTAEGLKVGNMTEDTKGTTWGVEGEKIVTPPTDDNPPATGDDTTPPATGDMTMVFALVALVAMAGAVVVTKKVR